MGSCPARQTKRNFDTDLFDFEKYRGFVWDFYIYIYIYINVLGDFGPEWVQNDPELVGDGPKHLRNTSGALLGQNMFSTKTYKNHETSRRLKTMFCSGKTHNKYKSAYRNSASFDVPDSSPSFILTPFVTKA